MRTFSSQGPVDCRYHYCVERKGLIKQAITQLIGVSEERGHYFTIWAPRQTGKTWLMRQVAQEIPHLYGDDFAVFNFSLGNLRGMGDIELKTISPPFPKVFSRLLENQLPGKPKIKDWEDFYQLFSKEGGVWNRPLILLIDEVDTAPPNLLDLIVGRFRELYLDRENNWLHGLALIGVRAVLGLDSPRGSPFNIQHSMHIPNLTQTEVEYMYQDYQTESGQPIEPAVVEAVYKNTNGQPGLVSWFGELLTTKKYNPDPNQPITFKQWRYVYQKALHVEFNNTVLNIVKKARTTYSQHVLELFSRSDVKFSLDTDWCNYMYMHGLIDHTDIPGEGDIPITVCRFSSPFIQYRVFNALTYDLFDQFSPVLALHPLDELTDVFADKSLNLPALLERYKDYLARLKAKGINPWKDQPRRKTDLHLMEAVGHFHLYAWLIDTLARRCVISPEFPTGNGKVDLHLHCGDKKGLIEVKSFKNSYQLSLDHAQAAKYAKSQGLTEVTIAVFVPFEDEKIIKDLSKGVVIDNIQVQVVAIGWV